jgi:hypothetical protein
VSFEVVWDFAPYSGHLQEGQLKHLYVLKQGERWVLLDEKFDTWVIIAHEFLWHPFQ